MILLYSLNLTSLSLTIFSRILTPLTSSSRACRIRQRSHLPTFPCLQLSRILLSCIDQLKVLVSNVNICCSFSFRSLDDKLSGPADLFMASSPWHSWKPCSCGVRSPKAVIPWVEEGSREGTQVFVKNTDAPRCLLPCVTAWPASAAGQVLLYNVYP